MRRLRGDQRGITVVELLVVLTILGIISAIVAVSTIRGLQADSQARERITAFEDMQIALERMSREVRAANPVVSAADDEIVVQVFRDDDWHCFRYALDGSDLVTQQQSTDGCQTFSDDERVLVGGLDDVGPAVFAYRDRDGYSLTEPIDTGDIGTVRITFVRSLLGERDVEVSTVVTLRNA